MEKNRSDDMITILQLNNSIDQLYKLLCNLELEGKKDSQEYKDYVDLIRFASQRCHKYMTRHNLGDKDINEFIQVLNELNHYDKYDPLNYIQKFDNIKIRRFIEHNYELSLIYHESDEDMYYSDQDGIIIENVKYDYETGLAMLEEEGYQDMADDCRFLMEQAKTEKEENEDRDDMDIAELQLETHTFMLYLLDAINEEQDEEIKKKLIEAKYRIISNIRSLELTFLYDQDLDIDLEAHQRELHNVFKKRKSLYLEYVLYLEQIIDHERMMLIERHKEKYDDLDDQVYDILLSILLKTHVSCIPNETVRNGILEDSDAGVQLAESKIDKKVLSRSMKLNAKYIIKESI